MNGLRLAFYVSAVMSLIAAIASQLRGKQYFHEAPTPAGPSFPVNLEADVAARPIAESASQSAGSSASVD